MGYFALHLYWRGATYLQYILSVTLYSFQVQMHRTSHDTWNHNALVAVDLGRSIYGFIRGKQAVMRNTQIELKRIPL